MAMKIKEKLKHSAKIIDLASKDEVKKTVAAPKPFNNAAKRVKARKAFDNAKYRCSNDENYKTTKFLLPSFEEFLQDIGLPPNSDVSLDRINPLGHYQIGNLRWANASIQAHNKKKSASGTYPPLSVLISKAKAEVQQGETRKAVAEAWMLMIRSFNRKWLLETEAVWLKDSPVPAGLLEANFDFSTVHDVAYDAGTFHLPSLAVPGRRIRLRGGPLRDGVVASHFQNRGVMYDLGYELLALNLSDKVRIAVNDDLETDGVTWVEQAEQDGISVGVEGQMLAIAARLQHHRKKTAALYPALHAISHLQEPRWTWQDVDHPIFRSEYLFIPDYQIDQGASFDLKYNEAMRLVDLLEYRIAYGKRTWVGVQNPHKLIEPAKKILLGQFKVREHSTPTALIHPSPESVALPNKLKRSLSTSQWSLERMKQYESCCHLFKAPFTVHQCN